MTFNSIKSIKCTYKVKECNVWLESTNEKDTLSKNDFRTFQLKLLMNSCRFSTNKPTFKKSDEKSIESAEFTQIHSSTFIIPL